MARILLILLAVAMLSVSTSGQSTIDLDTGLQETVIPLGSSLYLSLKTNQVDQLGNRVGAAVVGGYGGTWNSMTSPWTSYTGTWNSYN